MSKANSRRKPQPRHTYRVGDRVEIRNYKRAIAWGAGTPQRYGFITDINGAYIMVRPRWAAANRLIEFYPNEIKLAVRPLAK